jgi:PAS domain S-box-containing protein
MAAAIKSEVAKKIAAIQVLFQRQLPDKIAEIESTWEAREQVSASDTRFTDLHRMLHSLTGAGGTFGAMAVSVVAHELEQVVKSLLASVDQPLAVSSTVQRQVDALIAQLKQAADNWQPSDIPYHQHGGSKNVRGSNLIYLAEDDELLAVDLIANLEQAGYRVRHFTCLETFEAACGEEQPAAIIMDMVFPESDVTGEKIVSRLKEQMTACPPVVFISARDDIDARLAAARAGALRYFRKPLDMKAFVQMLDGLTAKNIIEPYRILLINDDEASLEFYAVVLTAAGMVVETLSNSKQGLTVLAEVKPDVIVIDAYMPECSGSELVQVIRQDDSWAQTPIIFLSTESNTHRQLKAMKLGADAFLVKPIEANFLVSTIAIKAKRARWFNRLNKDLKKALRESEYQRITMNQHDIVSSTDVAGCITEVNEKFCDISGYSREELLGQNHRMLKSDFHTREFYEEMWGTISQGKVWHGTICNRKKNGDEYWVESTIVPFLDENGKPYKYVSARTDITELRQNEERLSRSQKFSNIGTWDWNIRTGDLYWSDAVKNLFGFSRELKDVTFDHFSTCVHPDDWEVVNNAVKACLEQGTKYDIEHRVIWPDGSIRWMQERGDVIRNEEGVPLHMLGVVQDITVRKKAEFERAESERQLIEAQRLASIGSWQADLSNGSLTWSDEIYRIFGHQPGSFEPSIEAFLAAVHPDDRAKVRESEKRSEQTGRHDVVHRIVQPDGTVRHVHELAQAEIDAEGKVVRLTGTVQDITDRVKAEQALIDAREEAENANRAKSQFLSSMSHELRTPMNAIMGFGQLLKMEKEPALTESQEENVDEIVKASHHLLALINEVLDLAKIEAGRIDFSIEAIVIDEVINESVQLISPLAQRRGIAISLTQNGVAISAEQLAQQHLAVRADQTRLKQVLLNLLSNAVKYNSENGKIIIDCYVGNEEQTRISITDAGAGLFAEQQRQLFKAFSRLGAEQTDIEGTGIGLVITKNIVELMGGSIGVDSQPGKGCTFWIELPSDTLHQAQKNVFNKMQTNSPVSPIDFQYEHTVLYIEDNPANLRLVAQVLARRSNIHLWSAHEPLLGLELAAEHRPNLILLDINLPGMDGYGVLKHLRQREETRHTPVIAISANAMPRDIEKGMAAGFDGYITKPINVGTLLQAVDDVLLEQE